MEKVITIINFIFRLVFYPFQKISPLWGLIAVSVLTGIVMLVIFRFTSNQKKIKKIKNKIRAYILELVLYRDNIKVILKALINILKYNGIYLKQIVLPLIIVIGPVIIILVQLNFRYKYRSVKPNESVIVKLKLGNRLNNNIKVSMDVPEQIEIETPVLRIENRREFNWRIRGRLPGRYELKFFIDDERIKKSLQISSGFKMLSPLKVHPTFFKMLFNPSENPLPKRSKIEWISVEYPRKHFKIFHRNVPWLGIFFLISVITAFALKGILKVEI